MWRAMFALMGALTLVSPPATLIPAARMGSTVPGVEPYVLALDSSAFPAGSSIVRVHVDTTAGDVNAEGMLGAADAHGDTYAQLGFLGSLFESAQLSSVDGARHTLRLMATIFPSTAAAGQAFAADSRAVTCLPSPSVALPMRTRTCAYISATDRDAGMYLFASAGPVELIIRGDVSSASVAAELRAVQDVKSLARQEAGHVNHLLALGALAPPSAALAPTTPALCRLAPGTGAFPAGAQLEQPVVLRSQADFRLYSVAGSANSVFRADGFRRGCVQLVDLPPIAGARHGLSIETDVFGSTAGAQAAFRWLNRIELWVNPLPHILRVNAYLAPSLTLYYVDRGRFDDTSAYLFVRRANVLVALRSWTDAATGAVLAPTEADLYHTGPSIAADLARL